MKRLTAYISMIALIFSLGLNSSLAASGGGGGGDSQVTPPPLPTPCADTKTCVVYVNDVMNSIQDGDIAQPYLSLSAAVTFVASNADYNTIRIAGGLYTEQYEIFPIEVMDWSKDLHIQGGYNEDFTSLAPGGFPTIFDGDFLKDFLSFTNTGGSVKGLNIKGTKRALNISNTTGTISMTVSDNVFTENKEDNGISGLKMHIKNTSTAVVENNTFYGHNGQNDTLAHFNGGDITIRNNVFHNNFNETTFYCEDALVYNNYFTRSHANDVVIAVEYNCKLYHNTINLSNAENATIRTLGSGNEIVSNLLTTNIGGVSVEIDPNDPIDFKFNGFNGNASNPVLKDGNVSCNPWYSNANGTTPADLALGVNSSCIDKGLSVAAVTEDYFGLSRPANGDGIGSASADPGAYEVADPGLATPTISNLVATTPNPFSPNGDNYQDTVSFSFDLSEKAEVIVGYEDMALSEKQSVMEGVRSAGKVEFEWDGTYHENDVFFSIGDGSYQMEVTVKNSSGSNLTSITAVVDNTMVAPAEETPAEEEVMEEENEKAMEEEEVESSINSDNTPEEIADEENTKAQAAVTDTSGDKCADYKDVASNHPECKSLEFMKSKGAMTGNPDGNFAPAAALQRDQIAKIILVALGQFDENEDYCQGNDPFPDVTSEAWSYQYICRAVDLGLVTGYKSGADAGKYIPGRAVNRAEALALMLRHITDLPEITNSSFDDVGADQWFSGYAKFAQDNGLFLGSKLYSSDTTIRLEVADIIFKLEQLGKLTAQ